MHYKELPEITDRQKEILTLIYKFRFMNRVHVQKLFKHKDPRRVNPMLKDLTEKGYLGRIYKKTLLEINKPAIYYLNNNGILWNRFNKSYGAEDGIEFRYVKKFYEDKNASQSFINHCLCISDIYVQLKEFERNQKVLVYEITTKTENWITHQQHESNEDFDEIKDIIPDIYIEKFKEPYEEDIEPSSFFLQLFDAHVPRFALRYRINQYFKFKEEGDWEGRFGIGQEFPNILLILPNQQKLNFISRYIKELFDNSYDVEDIQFSLTTHANIMNKGVNDHSIWKIIRQNNSTD